MGQSRRQRPAGAGRRGGRSRFDRAAGRAGLCRGVFRGHQDRRRCGADQRVAASGAADWLAGQPAELEPAPTRADDAAFWLWTSGSTGSPKAAVHRQRDWLCCYEGYARGVLGIGPDDVVFSSSKLFHAYGLGNSLLFPFSAGANPEDVAGCLCLDDDVDGGPCFVTPDACSLRGLLARGGVWRFAL